MTIDKQNPTQQPLSLFSLSTGDLGLPVRSTPASRRDPKEQLAFMRLILEQALEIANECDADDFFSEISSPDNTNGDEEENSRSQNQPQ
jgi:hypothetical protein